MSRSIAIHFLLATALLASQVSSNPSQIRQIKFQSQNPYVVSIDSQLLVISKNQTHIRIDSSDKNYTTCEVVVDETEHEIPERIKATVLGSKKIVVYGVHNDSKKLMIKSVFHTILIVDPWHCELKTLKGLIQDKVPVFFPVISAEIVAHQNNQFDVFYLGPKECAPCRFDDEGRRIELKQQYKADRKKPLNLYVKQLEQNGSYAYAWNFKNSSSILKVLDQDFKVLNQFPMNNSLFDFSTNSNAGKSFISATYNTPDSPYEFFYTLFNSNLQPIFTNRLDEIDVNHIGLNALFNVDSKGNSFVSFEQMLVEEGDSLVSFISYDSMGKKIGSSFEFTKIPNDAFYEIQTLLVDDREYCLALHKLDEPFGETTIKCIDTSKRI